jgi:GAF domain-containing protein
LSGIRICFFAQQQGLFLVPDAKSDPRFCDNPLVLEELKIRFFVGMPLIILEGMALGAVCVVNRVPRDLSGRCGRQDALSLCTKRFISVCPSIGKSPMKWNGPLSPGIPGMMQSLLEDVLGSGK